MQVSSVLRTEAERLFWSDPDVWYSVEGVWLVGGGWPGYTHEDLDFLARVEQVEVQLHEIVIRSDGGAAFSMVKPWERTQSIEELAQSFWQTLHHRFPRATRVVLSETWARMNIVAPPSDLAAVVRACPASIRASASLMEEEPEGGREGGG